MTGRIVRTWWSLLVFFSWLAASASAQSTTGSISGVVTDQSKGVLPGVTVEARNEETGIVRSLATDESGRYRVLSLPPGRYRLHAELAGFQAVDIGNLLVQIGRDVPVDVTLRIGQVSESVTVQGEVSLVDLGAGVVGGVVTTTQIAELPLNGRSFMELATLQAGVNVSRATERVFSGGFGTTQVTIAGARPEQTGYLIEGTNIADVSDRAPSSVASVLLGVDTVREFSVQTHGYSAEFGRAAGGVISAVTKSGTNQFHGTTFEFHRNSALDARGYFDEGDEPPPFRRNQFGGTLGGPILRNKLFFFGSYEGLRERLGTTRIARFPNADAHRGYLPDGRGGLRFVGVHPTFQPYLDLLYPIPTGRDFGDGTAELVHAPTEPTDEDFVVGKIDWVARSKDSFLVRTSVDRANNQIWLDHPDFTNVTKTDMAYNTGQWQRVFTAHVLNEVRAALNRTVREITPTPLIDVPRSLWFLDQPIFGYIELRPSVLTVAGNNDDPAKYAQNLYQVSDTFTLNTGRNTWKAGFDVQRYHFDGFSHSRLGGNYRFRTLEEMLTLRRSATAQADRFTGVLPGVDTERHVRQNYAAFFVHDDVRMSNRVSLSLGLRYEFVTTPYELNGKLAGLVSLDDLESGPRGVTPGAPLFKNPSKKAGLAPRLGLSWTPFGDDRTTIRGGGGIFHQPLTVSYYRGTAFRIFPYFAGIDIRQPSVFGPAIQQVLNAGVSGVDQRSEFISYDTKQPFNVQWYLNVEHELPGAIVAEVGYLGSRGVNLPYYGDPNTTPSEYVDGVKRIVPDARLRYPSWGRVRTRTTGAESIYHALTLGAQKRLSQGLQFQANYTYSRSIDTWSGGLQGSNDYLTSAGSVVDWWDIEFERGRSAFDVPHNFVANAVYTLPFGRNLTGPAGALVRGWQVSGIATVSSGIPFYPIVGFDRAGDRQADTNMQRPTWAPGRTPQNAITGSVDEWFDPTAFLLPPAGTFGNVRRNSLRGPNLRVVDFSTFKNQQVGPTIVQFRIEVFNLFDRANFAPPSNPVLFNPDGSRIPGAGRITRLATPARQMQFGLKLLF